MGELILFMVASLDGFVSGPNGELDWEVRDPAVSAELVPEFLTTVKGLVIGRGLFRGFAQAWPPMAADPSTPKELADFARWLESAPKFVVSSTSAAPSWKNAQVVEVHNDADATREISALKARFDGDLVVFGGARCAQTLVRLGLVDEYRLKVQPVALGAGRPLFRDLQERRNLRLVRSKAYGSGVVAQYYRPA